MATISNADVPVAIQETILNHEPAKSLLRFRQVSKEWKDLISNPKFVSNYKGSSNILVSPTVAGEEFEVIIDDKEFPRNRFKVTDANFKIMKSLPLIKGVCEGLFLVRESLSRVIVWNPSVRRSVKIDLPPLKSPSYASVIGFGVHPWGETRDPRLVKIDHAPGIGAPWQVDVYSLNKDQWWDVPSCLDPSSKVVLTVKQISINGIIYFLCFKIVESGREDERLGIVLTFDLRSERFQEIHLPHNLEKVTGSELILSEFQGQLCVIEETECGKPTIWLKSPDQTLFNQLYTLELEGLSVIRLLGFRENKGLIVWVKTNTDDGGKLEEIFLDHEIHKHFVKFTSKAYSYNESLLLSNV